jgi:hypothetical protein
MRLLQKSYTNRYGDLELAGLDVVWEREGPDTDEGLVSNTAWTVDLDARHDLPNLELSGRYDGSSRPQYLHFRRTFPNIFRLRAWNEHF